MHILVNFVLNLADHVAFTSAGDTLLVDLAQVGDTSLVGAGSHALTVHGVPAEQSGLRDRKLLHDT